MTNTPNLGMPFIEGSQAQKHVTHNEALRILDAAIQIAVADLTRTSPPASPVEGERHVVASGATGAWASHDRAIATWQDGAWAYLAPKTGWCIWSVADNVEFVFDGASWRDLRDLPVTLDNAVHVGINTTASAPNLLSVKSNAALLSAIPVASAGSGDARLQISKETAAKTASVVFSNAFSGRAEFGLVASDAFRLKVSADGSVWVDAFSIDQSSGNVTLSRAVLLTGMIAPPQITANQNDYNPTGLATATVLQLSSDASRNLTGLAGGADGRVVSLLNVGSQPIALLDESASSSAANRFTLGATLTVAAKQAATLRYDGSAARWRLIAGSTGLLASASNLSDLGSAAAARANLSVREQLAANRTYYVRSDGSDANNGLSNASGGAFLTIQKAIDTVAAIDLSIYNVTIQVADGTYAGTVTVSAAWIGSGTVTLQGNVTTPANALISTGANDCITVFGGATLTVTGFKLTNTGTYLLHASSGSIRFSAMTFGSCGSQQVRATDCGRIVGTGNYSIDGGASNHWSSVGNGVIRVQFKTITLTGTPAFSAAFANADLSATVLVNGNTFSGSATGPRYAATNNAVISSGGAGASYLPGNAAGSTSNGGLYL